MQTVSEPLTQACFLVELIGVIVAAGIFGGAINFYLTRKADPEDSSFSKSVLLGLGAASLVPLFLKTISSGLLGEIHTNEANGSERVLVFFGFCLVASISSKAFIETISQRVLKDVRDLKEKAKANTEGVKEAKETANAAKEKASEVESAVEPIIAKETDIETQDQVAPAEMAELPVISEKERQLLEALANGKALRTRTSLTRELNAHRVPIEKPEVNELMDILLAQKLVDFKRIINSRGAQTRRWYITKEGREIVERLRHN